MLHKNKLNLGITRRTVVAVLLSLVALLTLSGLARAEDVIDPPRNQKAGLYNIEFVSPQPGSNQDAEKDTAFSFRVTDAQGKSVDNLQLNVTGIRDYSGQVKKEHNGPRTPNAGPVALRGTGNGEYGAALRFEFVGHWYIQVDGPSLGQQAVKFRTPIGAAPNKGAGIGLDWLVWAGLVLTVVGIVVVTGRKGHVFPTPHEELKEPVPASTMGDSAEAEAGPLAASGSIKK